MKQIFIKDNYYCILEKNEYEPIEHFLERGNYIVSLKPTNLNDYNKAIIMSNIYINKKYLKCCYNNLFTSI
jgi:hypothetical protein